MIVVGLVFVSLLLLAFAGGALGDERPPGERTSGWEAGLFVLLLLGIILKRKPKDDEDF